MNQVSSLPARTPKTEKGRRTQRRLLEAAKDEFAERGFHEAAISGITQRAGVALGTFYVYFNSKEEIFRELVDFMGRATRAHIAKHVVDAPDRAAAERMGLEAFIAYVRQNKAVYRIIMEAQFVAEDAYKRYYEVFSEAYYRNLVAAGAEGKLRPGDEETRSWALIGMSVFLGMRYAVWEDARPVEEIGAAIEDLLRRGLGP
jgi:AcrR family transcriptional regulator